MPDVLCLSLENVTIARVSSKSPALSAHVYAIATKYDLTKPMSPNELAA